MKSFVKFLGKLFGKPALEAAAVETAEKRLLKILKLIIFSTVALLFLSACGSDSSTSTNKTYKYSFSVPGCQPTLFQGRFSSQAEMCRALYFQSQNYACAAQETLRYFEAQNCHRSDFLQNQLPGTSMAQPGTFYNHNGQSYMMTPQGPIRLEDQPELDSLRSEFSANDLGDMIIENGVLKRPHENIHMNSSGTKVIIDGNLEIELSNAQPMSVDTEDPRAHTPTGSSTLVAPESVASETRRSTPTPPTTTTPRRLDTSGADLTLDTRSEETDRKSVV